MSLVTSLERETAANLPMAMAATLLGGAVGLLPAAVLVAAVRDRYGLSDGPVWATGLAVGAAVALIALTAYCTIRALTRAVVTAVRVVVTTVTVAAFVLLCYAGLALGGYGLGTLLHRGEGVQASQQHRSVYHEQQQGTYVGTGQAEEGLGPSGGTASGESPGIALANGWQVVAVGNQYFALPPGGVAGSGQEEQVYENPPGSNQWYRLSDDRPIDPSSPPSQVQEVAGQTTPAAGSGASQPQGGTVCLDCDGTGRCRACNGTGREWTNRTLGAKVTDSNAEFGPPHSCKHCGGTGVCPMCKGQR